MPRRRIRVAHYLKIGKTGFWCVSSRACFHDCRREYLHACISESFRRSSGPGFKFRVKSLSCCIFKLEAVYSRPRAGWSGLSPGLTRIFGRAAAVDDAKMARQQAFVLTRRREWSNCGSVKESLREAGGGKNTVCERGNSVIIVQ